MFWIGLIVGVVLATVAIVGYAVYCNAKVFGTWDNFESMCDTAAAAMGNLDSMVQVWHDGELIDERIFEKK